MVSFWPFGREDANSPKSFEKSLATLSDKIQRLQVRDDTLRATHRRVKVLFTLYASFIYILVTAILVLVTGYQRWTATEWTGVASSPVGIFLVRYVLDLYFDWREGNVRTRLERKIKERDVVIKKLKAAMRYDSTKELLDKYGGTSPGKKRVDQPQTKTAKSHSRQSSANFTQRTGFAPPPTANIPNRSPSLHNSPVEARPATLSASPIQSALHSREPSNVSESFAPNAFEDWQQVQAPSQPARTGFLDRMLDLIVGEDESAPRNRIVLLCTSCRTVNGQAPPGTRSLAEIGRWRCGTCGAWNGTENEVGKVLNEAKVKGIQNDPVPSITQTPAGKEDIARSKQGDDESPRLRAAIGDSEGEDEIASSPTTSTRKREKQDS